MGFFRFCAKGWVILLSFVAMLALGYSFSFVQQGMNNVPLLDMVHTADAAAAQLAAMSDAAKRTHMIGTATLDMVYPVSILMFTGGLIFRFAPQPVKGVLAFVPVIAMTVDYAENIMILIALAGQAGILDMKTMLTAVKFPVYGFAFLFALLSLVYGTGKGMVRMMRGSRS